MRRLIRGALGLVLALVALTGLVLAGFSFAAAFRETEPAEQAAGFGARFVDAGGLKMHYKQWGPDDGRPLLLIHGAMAWSDTFRDIAEPLGRQGFRVIAPDLPPFGFSERPADGDYSRAAQARRILAFADALKLERFALGVHSYGGGAAVEAAFEAPGRISSLVLLDVALGLGATEASEPPLAALLSFGPIRNLAVSATFTNPLLIGKGLRDFVQDDRIVTGDRIALYARPLVMPGTTRAIGQWLFTGLYADERRALSADLSRYRTFDRPVLVIWGREDTVTPLGQGEMIAAAFPRGRLEVLDHVNHIPHIEWAKEVERLIAEFLDSPAAQNRPVASRANSGTLRGTIAE